MHDGLPATLIADSAAATLMAQGKVDAIVVGADRIAANGDTANKIGTYSLAVNAKYHKWDSTSQNIYRLYSFSSLSHRQSFRSTDHHV